MYTYLYNLHYFHFTVWNDIIQIWAIGSEICVERMSCGCVCGVYGSVLIHKCPSPWKEELKGRRGLGMVVISWMHRHNVVMRHKSSISVKLKCLEWNIGMETVRLLTGEWSAGKLVSMSRSEWSWTGSTHVYLLIKATWPPYKSSAVSVTSACCVSLWTGHQARGGSQRRTMTQTQSTAARLTPDLAPASPLTASNKEVSLTPLGDGEDPSDIWPPTAPPVPNRSVFSLKHLIHLLNSRHPAWIRRRVREQTRAGWHWSPSPRPSIFKGLSR